MISETFLVQLEANFEKAKKNHPNDARLTILYRKAMGGDRAAFNTIYYLSCGPGIVGPRNDIWSMFS